MKSETASFIAHGIIWLGVLIAAIIGALCGGSPGAMVTTVLFGVLGTFSVLAINSVKRKGAEQAKGNTPVAGESGKKTASERMTELNKLREMRMITPEEFERKKAEILQSL